MSRTVDCPLCKKFAIVVDWSGNAECNNCGAKFNEKEVHERNMKIKREEHKKTTGKIDGVPEGWILVRIGTPNWNENYINLQGKIDVCIDSPFMHNRHVYPIVWNTDCD
jgi:hypothetical protein